jgi:hypothetical protein
MQAVKGNKTGTYQDALLLERNGELKDAATLYAILHKEAPGNLKILSRLIIIYRKLKDAVKEIRYINAAIKIHEQYYTSHKIADKKAIAISKKLNQLLGYTDKKGRSTFKPDELLKLEIRRNRLQDKQDLALRKK